MYMRIGISRIIFIAGVLACVAAAAHSDVIVPLGIDPFRFDYELIYRTGVEKQDFSFIPSTGPIFLDRAAKILGSYSLPSLDLIRASSQIDRIRFFTISSEKVAASRNKKFDDLPSLVGGFSLFPNNHLGMLSFFNLDRAKAIDPSYTGKKYRGLAGDLETAALFYTSEKVTVALGRFRVFWGPQPVNLSLSETVEPLDQLAASYHIGRLTFNFLFARLDGSRPTAVDSIALPDRTFSDNRYLAAHRLDIRLHRRLRMGLFETVLYGGEGRPPELYYLNPLQFFHAAQLNENKDDNTTIGFDFICLPGKGTNIYGQLLVDDFQIDRKAQGDQEPNEIGLMVGAFKTGKVGTLLPDLKAEYVRITNRTYNQIDPVNRYLFRNKVIGHPLGNDVDSLSLKARFWPEKTSFIELEAAYRRRGEGSIYKPWDQPWIDITGSYHEPFPTGVVEKAALVAVRASGYLPLSSYTRRHFFLTLDAGAGSIKNSDHISGKSATTAWFNIKLAWLGATDLSIAD